MKFLCSLFFIICIFTPSALSQGAGGSVFKVVPLGVTGGIDESNLSSYLLAAAGTDNFICLDAGTLHYGIQKAVSAGAFRESASHVLKKYIKAYLISHPHLDHVAGLIINSPEDSLKTIYGLPHCIQVLKEKYFTWESWANFADDGDKPLLKKYHYHVLEAGKETPIENTRLFVRAFALSHVNPYESTAFLIRNKENYLLYLGDTGTDTLEKSRHLEDLWKEISPLVLAKKLKAIFIEASFQNRQPYNQLFGHLTPQLLMQEMGVLAKLTGKDALNGFPLVITHMKPDGDQEKVIKNQLILENLFKFKLIFPQQGKLMRF